MVADVPHLAMIDEVPENEGEAAAARAAWATPTFVQAVRDHYLTNPIAARVGP